VGTQAMIMNLPCSQTNGTGFRCNQALFFQAFSSMLTFETLVGYQLELQHESEVKNTLEMGLKYESAVGTIGYLHVGTGPDRNQYHPAA